ncbi:MAG TPA: helix-turn-helix domain-containing protein [Methanomicrobiales archaeon]|nr:helix-turn-helix domain-containing protein [Methanomicrobiales archaeon]
MQIVDYQKMVGKRFITAPLARKSLGDDAEKLTKFGLTQNQARIYLAILSLGTTQIEPISKVSAVRREDIYRILPKLYEMGIVERVIGTPTRVRALPVDRALRVLVKNRQEALSRESAELDYQVDEFLEYFSPVTGATGEDAGREQFVLLDGDPAIGDSVAGLLGRAEDELLVACSGPRASPLMSGFTKVLDSLATKGIRVRVITGESDVLALPLFLKGLRGRELDFRFAGPGGSDGNFLVADGKEAVLITSGEEEEGKEARVSSLWTRNASLVTLLRGNFEKAWSGGRDIREWSEPLPSRENQFSEKS